MPGRVLSAKTCSFAWGSGLPSNTCFLGSIRVHNPNGISIGSAVFAQLMAQCCRRCQVCASPQNCPSHGGSEPRLIRCSLGQPDSASQVASRSDQPFMHSSRQTVPILYNGRCSCPRPKKLVLPKGESGPQPKRHFDRFSRFCMAYYCDRQTHRPRYSVCNNKPHLRT